MVDVIPPSTAVGVMAAPTCCTDLTVDPGIAMLVLDASLAPPIVLGASGGASGGLELMS